MATVTQNQNETPEDASRQWNIFALKGYAAIVARKHSIVVPTSDIELISNEELVVRLRLVADLAHLPPA
jgi:hypothetical protein